MFSSLTPQEATNLDQAEAESRRQLGRPLTPTERMIAISVPTKAVGAQDRWERIMTRREPKREAD